MKEDTMFTDLSISTKIVLYGIGTCALGIIIIWVVFAVQWMISLIQPFLGRGVVKRKNKFKKRVDREVHETPHYEPSNQKTYKELIKESKAAKNRKASNIDKNQGHPLFLTSFKEHQNKNTAVAWMRDASAMCTACEDEVVRLFDFSSGVDKGVKIKPIHTMGVPVGVGYYGGKEDVAVLMKGAVDAATLELFSQEQTESGFKRVSSAQKSIFGNDPPMKMICTRSAAGGCPVIVCCSETKSAVVFDRKGTVLSVIEPNSFKNHDMSVSHDGRFVSIATFTADAKIWELQYKNGTYQGCSKVMDLKGHRSQIMSVAFTMDSETAVTASKDGTMKVWNINVWYQKNEDPKCLRTVPLDLPQGSCYHRMAFGPKCILAAACGGDIHFIDISTGCVIDKIENAHDGSITDLAWSPTKAEFRTGPVFALATVGHDHRARLWRSPQS